MAQLPELPISAFARRKAAQNIAVQEKSVQPIDNLVSTAQTDSEQHTDPPRKKRKKSNHKLSVHAQRSVEASIAVNDDPTDDNERMMSEGGTAEEYDLCNPSLCVMSLI